MPLDNTAWPTSPIAEHLIRAKAHIVQNGWAKQAQDGLKSCALVAICRVIGGGTKKHADLVTAAREAFARGAGLESRALVAVWNDAPERTLSEVLAAFDRAIELASAEATV